MTSAQRKRLFEAPGFKRVDRDERGWLGLQPDPSNAVASYRRV